MKLKKKFFTYLYCLVYLFMLVGCGKKASLTPSDKEATKKNTPEVENDPEDNASSPWEEEISAPKTSSEIEKYRPVLKPSSLVAGVINTCLLHGGEVKCWGDNQNNQITSDLGKKQILTPTGIQGFKNKVVQLVVGGSTFCGLTEKGEVKCWGKPVKMIGRDTKIEEDTSIAKPVVGIDSNIVRISAGINHLCALSDDEQLYCWGVNDFQQLGNGSKVSTSIPVNVGNEFGTGVIQITASFSATCALYDSGKVKCLGSNFYGGLGVETIENSAKPVLVDSLASEVEEIYAGGHITCAKKKNESLWCWGAHEYAGVALKRKLPSEVLVETMAPDALAVNDNFSCASIDGVVMCWGKNDKGQIGDGSATYRPLPEKVSNLPNDALDIVVGNLHTCALFEGPRVWCWGANTYGQLGNSTKIDSFVPVEVVF